MTLFFENNYVYYPSKSGKYTMLKSILFDRVKVSYQELQVGDYYYVNSKSDDKSDEFRLVKLDKKTEDKFYFIVIKPKLFDDSTITIDGLNNGNYTFYKNAFNKESNLNTDYFSIKDYGKNRFQLAIHKTGVIAAKKR